MAKKVKCKGKFRGVEYEVHPKGSKIRWGKGRNGYGGRVE